MHKTIKTITIVGGGSSGWLAAAFLLKNTSFNITLIDKEVGASVGVGEGTLLHFNTFLIDCGFPQEEWFNEIDATHKAGILSPKWGGAKKLVWHPFNHDHKVEEHNTSVYECLTYYDQDDFNELSNYFVPSIENRVVANLLNTGYALHVDCGKLVQWIQEKIKDKITIIKSDVIEINRKNNIIENLTLKNGQSINSDFYIDCTGFKQLLQNTPERVNLNNRLFCDTAVAGHVPYIDKDKEMTPYVISEAVDHGWIWKIPVRSRIGSGLVFKRDITSIDEAKSYLCNHWNNRISPENLKVIDWTPYYNKNMWDGNVVAIGLSGGFIEPLESTGLAVITNSIRFLAKTISPGYYDNFDIKSFNDTMISIYENAVDFINMHYVYSDYDTPFWNHVKSNIVHSDTYHYYKNMLESGDRLITDGKALLFGGANWLCWMMQIEKNISKTNHINDDIVKEVMNEWTNILRDQYYDPRTVLHTEVLK